ncbi:MAG: hypothetical protein AAF927_32055 [Bacteroidota bacterium]
MRFSLLFISIFCFTTLSLSAQQAKKPVFGEVGLGFGQALFIGDMQTQLTNALGGSFEPSIGNNLMMGYYLAPAKWRGLGIGTRIHGTFGTPVSGTQSSQYVFNYYNLALTAKYYPFSQTFNQGFYLRASAGFGQMTVKRLNESSLDYVHQYAIGSSLTANLGYTFAFETFGLGLEAHYEYANRNGTVSGEGDGVRFISGQLGANLILSF